MTREQKPKEKRTVESRKEIKCLETIEVSGRVMQNSEPEIDENIVKCRMRIIAPKQHSGGKVSVPNYSNYQLQVVIVL